MPHKWILWELKQLWVCQNCGHLKSKSTEAKTCPGKIQVKLRGIAVEGAFCDEGPL